MKNSHETLLRNKHARYLRKETTPSESKLWAALRNRRFVNFKFRRQQPIGPYIADFCCWARSIVIELDGESHIGNEEHDAKRQQYLEAQGWKVLRFWDVDVFDNLEGVMQAILLACEAQPLTPRASTLVGPLPKGEGDGASLFADDHFVTGL